jgi:hypothetical protein
MCDEGMTSIWVVSEYDYLVQKGCARATMVRSVIVDAGPINVYSPARRRASMYVADSSSAGEYE